MTKLYDLTDSFKELEKMLEDGEIDQAVFNDTAESIELDISEKLENMQKLKCSLDADIEGFKKEVERLSKIIKSKQSQIASIESYTINELKKIGKSSIDTSIGKVKITKGRKSVVVDIDKLSDFHWKQFVKAKTTYQPDKKAIKDSLDSGDIIDGASFVFGDDKVVM